MYMLYLQLINAMVINILIIYEIIGYGFLNAEFVDRIDNKSIYIYI